MKWFNLGMCVMDTAFALLNAYTGHPVWMIFDLFFAAFFYWQWDLIRSKEDE